MTHHDEFGDRVLRLLRDPRVWQEPAAFRMPPGLAAKLARIDAEDAAAAALCNRLLVRPMSLWRERVRTTPGTKTAGMVRELLHRMPGLIEHSPADALEVTSIALAIAEVLDERAYWPEYVVTARAQAFRDHAYVLSFLGRYREALVYVERAERTFSQTLANPFDLARLALVKASALRMQQRSEEAIALTRQAAEMFLDLDERERYVNARMTEAAMLYDGGAIRQAMDVWSELAGDPGLDETGEVRIAHNIAVCLCDLGRQAEAVEPLRRCMAELGRLGLPTERARSRWYLGNALRGTARPVEAIGVLRAAWSEFRELGMFVDAALAALDLAEALVENGQPAEVPAICREVIAQLTDAGLAEQAMPALALLREAAAMGGASRELIRNTQATLRRVGQPSFLA